MCRARACPAGPDRPRQSLITMAGLWCSARGHDRRVFGDIADTSTAHGLAFLGASHAMEEGVNDGSAARVCAVGDAGRGEPAGVVPALRDSSGYGLQVAGAVGARGDVAGRPLEASAHDATENTAGDRTAGSFAARSWIRRGARAR